MRIFFRIAWTVLVLVFLFADKVAGVFTPQDLAETTNVVRILDVVGLLVIGFLWICQRPRRRYPSRDDRDR
ncbi:MAG: hypothetical protein HZA80_02875 [Candidatus Taylorbacteria bacterium]|nr:hypothetical protein [Candidatus Taylorbacteria bacterium]